MKRRPSLAAFFLVLMALAAPILAQQSTTGPLPPKGLDPGLDFSSRSQVVIYGVPTYIWHHGCGPTALGMVVGFWDASGYPDLVTGDASTQTDAVDAMIAVDNNSGYCGAPYSDHYQDYACPIDASPGPLQPDRSETGGVHADNCIADFMFTSRSANGNYYGWSWSDDIADAFIQYVSMIYPGESIQALDIMWEYMTWEQYKTEIDARRPVVFLVDTDGDSWTDHFVTGVGYDDATMKYGIYNTWDHSLHWYAWRPVAPGAEWGIFGMSTFSLDVECFDTDGDGLGDPGHPENTCMEDNCPYVYNPNQSNIDGDEMGDLCDPDIDGDGLLNGDDNCPYVNNPGQTNSDADSLGDVCDNCPYADNDDQWDDNDDGVGDECDGEVHIHFEDLSDTLYLDQYFEYSFHAVGATRPYYWFMAGGDLPFGMSFEGGTDGRLYGTPNWPATYFITVGCNDSGDPCETDTAYGIMIRVDTMPPEPVCGDADGNFIVNISDAVYLIAYIFGGGPPPVSFDLADSDCNGIVNISDTVYLIAYIFGGGPEPCAACPKR